jgi:hypothetical protein
MRELIFKRYVIEDGRLVDMSCDIDGIETDVVDVDGQRYQIINIDDDGVWAIKI